MTLQPGHLCKKENWKQKEYEHKVGEGGGSYINSEINHNNASGGNLRVSDTESTF